MNHGSIWAPLVACPLNDKNVSMSQYRRKTNPLAESLNDRIKEASPEVFAMLSPLGRDIYFPKGILSQSAEADEKAHRFNATIGIATEQGDAMHLPSIKQYLRNIEANEIYPYAPAGGVASLRAKWLAKQRSENPLVREKTVGLPIVTSGITHGLSLVGDLFVDRGDCIVAPDKLWGNYRLTYEVRYGGRIVTFPLFENDGFNVAGFTETIKKESSDREKLFVLLNFPNNPTGYMLTQEESHSVADTLIKQAETGIRLVVICDDAYFGLFYHLAGQSSTESLFGMLAGAHRNLLAIRLDGATKELFAWGLRCGFLTIGPGEMDDPQEVLGPLDAKFRGAIRSGISNSPLLSQTLVERSLDDVELDVERSAKLAELKTRAELVRKVANASHYRESWRVYPFNSGYFMCIALLGVEAEAVRLLLLDRYGTGLIAASHSDLRIAFSCLEVEEIEPLFGLIDTAVKELR